MTFETVLTQAKILIVDDEKANVRFLEIILDQAGYTNVCSTTDARQARDLFCDTLPDVVLLDLSMPHLDGFAVMQQLQEMMVQSPVPILVLTADVNPATKHKALKQGARDFLAKPLDETEVLLRIHNLLEARFYSVLLEVRVKERTQQLKEAELETLDCLAAAGEYRDDDTGRHTQRVGETAASLAQRLGLPDERVNLIRRAAPLHDVGKIGISDLILLKPGKLTSEEFTTMQQHTIIGAGILSRYHTPLLQLAQSIALTHHERWNGRGYPNGLQGEDIPLEGRIVAVADVFDALTSERPYKKPWPVAEAVAEIESQSGGQFDERVVQAFLTLPHETLI